MSRAVRNAWEVPPFRIDDRGIPAAEQYTYIILVRVLEAVGFLGSTAPMTPDLEFYHPSGRNQIEAEFAPV